MNQALPLFCCGLLLLGETQNAGSILSVKALSGIMKDKWFSAIYTCYKCCQKSSCSFLPITLLCTNHQLRRENAGCNKQTLGVPVILSCLLLGYYTIHCGQGNSKLIGTSFIVIFQKCACQQFLQVRIVSRNQV